MVIGVDFDGTLSVGHYKFPGIGKPNKDLFDKLRTLQCSGSKIILWTCREGKDLDDAVEWCKKNKLEFDAVNDNLPDRTRRFNNNSRKLFCDLYIDDASLSPEEFVRAFTEQPFINFDMAQKRSLSRAVL